MPRCLTAYVLLEVVVRMSGNSTREGFVPSEKSCEIYGQAIKCIWWMPWRQQAMKDVVACDKPRGAGKQALIRGFPNGATQPARVIAQ
jgi:hypothetical protein